MQQRNLAARAGRWSARHRRKAILGWLAFVVISVLIGGALGMKEIASEDLGDGESKQADQILADAFPDRAGEEVLIQGQGGIGPTTPRFRAAVARWCGRSRLRHRAQRPVAAGARQRLAHLPGRPLRPRDLRPPRGRRRAGGQRHAGAGGGRARAVGQPRPAHRGVRRRERGQGAVQGLRGRPAQGGDALAADHAGDPGARVRLAGGGGRAAPARDLGGGGGSRLGRGLQPGRPGRPEHLVGDPADRPGRRRRLLPVLPAARARGERPATRRRRPFRRRLPHPAGPCSSRASR